MSGRRICLMLAVVGQLFLFAQPKDPAPSVFDGFPIPPASKSLLFYIQRNKNANTILYEAQFDANGRLAEKDPVKVNWIRYTNGAKYEPISLLESNIAYGVRHKHTTEGVAWMKFVASDKYPFRVEVDGAGQAVAHMFINGHYARLERAEIHAKEDSFWPKILYVDLFGTDVLTGKEVMERAYP